MVQKKIYQFFLTLFLMGTFWMFSTSAYGFNIQKKSFMKTIAGQPTFAPGKVVLELPKGMDLERAGQEVESRGFIVTRASKWSRTLVVSVPAGEELRYVDYFKTEFHFRRVLPDYLGLADVTNYTPYSYPNDPAYATYAESASGLNDWYLHQVGIDRAWNDSDPWMATASKGRSTAVIAVIDTGINLAHEDLPLNLWKDPIGGNIGENFVDTTGVTDVSDTDGHGTWVTGVASANTNNSRGGAGFCVNCTVLVLKASDTENAGSYVPFADAITFAVQNGAVAINLSWSFPVSTFQPYTTDAWNSGSIVVASMGNTSINNVQNTPLSPAADTYAIGVGATDPDNTLSPYSIYGSWVGMCAPVGQIINGDGVFTDGVTCGSTPCGDPCTSCYVVADGTSFSSIQISAMVAILADLGLPNTDIVNRLFKTADHLGLPPYPNTLFGWGNLNAYRCLASCRPPSALHSISTPNGVSLYWFAPQTTAFATNYYIVLRSSTSGGPYTQMGQTLDGNTTYFFDSNASPGVHYYYVVKAVDNQQLITLPSNESYVKNTESASNCAAILYPNPIKGTSPAWIYLPCKRTGSIHVQIFSTVFRKVNDVSLGLGSSGSFGPLEPKDQRGQPLANGLYYLVISGDGNRVIRKWIVLK